MRLVLEKLYMFDVHVHLHECVRPNLQHPWVKESMNGHTAMRHQVSSAHQVNVPFCSITGIVVAEIRMFLKLTH